MRLQNRMPGGARAALDGAARAQWVRWYRWARALQIAHLSLWTLWASQSIATPISGRMPPPQQITSFAIDRTEVTIGEVAAYAQATGFVSQAEREGGGFEFDGGWTRRPNWTWRTPFGVPASADEPAVHLSFAEALAVCQWRGMRLPTDAQWIEAGYTERRPVPTPPFERGRSYPYPTGDQPTGAHCLADCGRHAMTPAPSLTRLRGGGHVRTGQTQAGVNGLFDMGGNVWEWVDETVGSERRTRGGSWWYGSTPMHVSHQASKPPHFYAVYVGFRCIAD